MAFYPLERLIHLYDGYCRSFTVADYSLLLIQNEGVKYLVVNRCPHQQAPLDRASIHHNKLRCPVHGMAFDLETGVTDDGCSNRLQFLPLVYQDAFVGVEF